ncbi:hypothetical protein IAU59_005801 [Kwoniella sp. CBS 9459]
MSSHDPSESTTAMSVGDIKTVAGPSLFYPSTADGKGLRKPTFRSNHSTLTNGTGNATAEPDYNRGTEPPSRVLHRQASSLQGRPPIDRKWGRDLYKEDLGIWTARFSAQSRTDAMLNNISIAGRSNFLAILSPEAKESVGFDCMSHKLTIEDQDSNKTRLQLARSASCPIGLRSVVIEDIEQDGEKGTLVSYAAVPEKALSEESDHESSVGLPPGQLGYTLYKAQGLGHVAPLLSEGNLSRLRTEIAMSTEPESDSDPLDKWLGMDRRNKPNKPPSAPESDREVNCGSDDQ